MAEEMTAGSSGTPSQGYLLDNAAQQTGGRFSGLDAGLDENTQAHLSALGIAAGWRCLEVGAGSGSIARWMAERVGAHGYVLATDIDTRWIQGNGLSQLEVQRHDVIADPLAQGEFDLVHARLVLSWLPTRDAVVSRLVAALRPGGWLVVEDFDSVLHHCLDPLNDDERVFDKVTDAFGEALQRRGADTTWAHSAPPSGLGRAPRYRRGRAPDHLPRRFSRVPGVGRQHQPGRRRAHPSRPDHGRRTGYLPSPGSGSLLRRQPSASHHGLGQEARSAGLSVSDDDGAGPRRGRAVLGRRGSWCCRRPRPGGLWFRSQDRPARGRRGEVASRLGE